MKYKDKKIRNAKRNEQERTAEWGGGVVKGVDGKKES